MTTTITNCDAKQRTNLHMPDPDTNRETDWLSDFDSEFWFLRLYCFDAAVFAAEVI